MGLFDIFKTKLTPEQKNTVQELESFYSAFKSRHGFKDGWHSFNFKNNDFILAFNSIQGIDDFALSLHPSSLGVDKKDVPSDIVIDLSVKSQKNWEECQKEIPEMSKSLSFFETQFTPQNIISEDESILPRLSEHPAGQTGFWLWMPLPKTAFQHVEKFDVVTKWCVKVAEKLSRL